MSKFSSRQLFEGGMAQELRFVADENGMLLFASVEMHDGFGDLAHQVAALVRRLQIRLQHQLPEQMDGTGVRVPGRGHGLVQPLRVELGTDS